MKSERNEERSRNRQPLNTAGVVLDAGIGKMVKATADNSERTVKV